MVQVMFRGMVATSVAVGASITTGNVQVLPSWAPPIEYIGTTTPWKVNFMIPTTTTGRKVVIGQAGVRAYGRKSNLHSGADCIALDEGFVTAGLPLLIVTYRAVGELSRPE